MSDELRAVPPRDEVRHGGRSALYALAVGALLVGAVIFGWRRYVAHAERVIDSDTELALAGVAARLDEFMRAHLGAARVLRESWQRYGSRNDDHFRRDADAIALAFPGFQALNWVDENDVIRWTFPAVGNEAARDVIVRRRPQSSAALDRAHDNHDLSLSAPLDLAQGGMGVVAYLPLMRDGAPVGLINAVFRLDDVLAQAVSGNIGERFVLQIADQEGTAIELGPDQLAPDQRGPPERPEVDVERSRVATITVGDRTWTLTLTPKVDAHEVSSVSHVLLGLSLVGAVALAALLFQLLRTREARRTAELATLRAASVDALTGLGNRTAFERCLDAELASTSESRPLAVVLCNAMRFRLVNSAYGPTIGDAILVEIARRLVATSATARVGADRVFRWSGDELAIICAGDDAVRATAFAHSLDAELRRPHTLGEVVLSVPCALGVAVAPAHGASLDALVSAATNALHEARSRDALGVVTFDESLKRLADESLSLEVDLRRAIAAAAHPATGELRLDYQPIVNLLDGTLRGFEALARWHHPTRGRVTPDRFIPLAERSGLIEPLGRWILHEACRQAAQWITTSGRELTIAVNLSPRQLLDTSLPRLVQATLAETGLPARLLVLEVTESLLIENVGTAVGLLGNIRAVGVSLALDDFGTGYSSLSYLTQLPIAALKIDRSFVERLGPDPRVTHLTDALVKMAKGLQLAVVAEGVESHEQLALLRASGCDSAQGWLFDKALGPDEAGRRITHRWSLLP